MPELAHLCRKALEVGQVLALDDLGEAGDQGGSVTRPHALLGQYALLAPSRDDLNPAG